MAATIDELTTQFLVPQVDGLPFQSDDSLITPIVDDDLFNDTLGTVLSSVGTAPTVQGNQGHYILIHNWWLGLLGGQGKKGDGFGNFVTDVGLPYFLNGPPRFENPDGTGNKVGGTANLRLIKILKDKAKAGVDVRVMGWMAFGITDLPDAAGYAAKIIGNVNGGTIRSIADLRRDSETGPGIGFRAIVDAISHTAGASHFKLMIVITPTSAVGFTGGIDFEISRWAKPFHLDYVDDRGATQSQFWHDVVAQVEGPAVKGLYDWYKTVWDENVSRKPKVYKTVDRQPGGGALSSEFFGHAREPPNAVPPLPVYPAPPGLPPGNHRVQSLRTAPQANFEFITGGIPESPKLTFAPNGLQEFQRGIQKAISGAKRYIYLEDQLLYSADIMSYIYDAIRANANLKIILITGGRDPNDQQQPGGYLANAINFGLLQGNKKTNPELTESQRAQVRLFVRLSELKSANATIASVTPAGELRRVTLADSLGQASAENELANVFNLQLRQGDLVFPVVGNPAIAAGAPLVVDVKPGPFDVNPKSDPQVGACTVVTMRGILMHGKVTLIDDACAIIGSANCMQRSLYTDLEHSVSFVDIGSTVRDFRCRLWSDHFRHATPSDFNDIDKGLHAWNRLWGPQVTGPAPPRPPHIVQRDLPIKERALSDAEVLRYELLTDVDSRQSWGGFGRLRRLKSGG